MRWRYQRVVRAKTLRVDLSRGQVRVCDVVYYEMMYSKIKPLRKPSYPIEKLFQNRRVYI